jgi:predicted PurR-regulated permease PerM
MTLALLLMLLVPLGLAFGALVGNMDTIVMKAQLAKTYQLPPAPDWVARIPFEGPELSANWQQLAAAGPGSLSASIAPYAGQALRWLAAQLGSVGGMILHFLLTVIIATILYANGETAARGVRKFAARLAGSHGDKAAVLAAATIRAVAMGVIVTAIVQTLIATVGLLVASIPGAGLLAAIVFVSCLIQLGPMIALLPVIAWRFYSGDTVGGSLLLVFALVAQVIDNFLRPYLIKRGADLPILLIFTGVIGGMLGFGVMGIFIGPVILAVAYVLLQEWIASKPRTATESAMTTDPPLTEEH